MRDRIIYAASIAVLVIFGIMIGSIQVVLFIRTEAALVKASEAQAAQSALITDLTEKILPAMQRQIDGILSSEAYTEP